MSQQNRGNASTPRATGVAGAGAGGMQEQATEVKEQVQQAAMGLKAQVTEQATGRLEEQKSAASEGLNTVAQAIRQTGSHLRGQQQEGVAQYVDRAAEQIEQFAGYLGGRDLRQLTRDIESFARREPALFLGGALTLGLLAGRFLKSSGTNGGADEMNWRGQSEWYGRPASGGMPYTGYSSSRPALTAPTGRPLTGTGGSMPGTDVGAGMPAYGASGTRRAVGPGGSMPATGAATAVGGATPRTGTSVPGASNADVIVGGPPISSDVIVGGPPHDRKGV